MEEAGKEKSGGRIGKVVLLDIELDLDSKGAGLRHMLDVIYSV